MEYYFTNLSKIGMAKTSSYERKLISELIDTLETSDLDTLDRIFYPEYKKNDWFAY